MRHRCAVILWTMPNRTARAVIQCGGRCAWCRSGLPLAVTPHATSSAPANHRANPSETLCYAAGKPTTPAPDPRSPAHVHHPCAGINYLLAAPNRSTRHLTMVGKVSERVLLREGSPPRSPAGSEPHCADTPTSPGLERTDNGMKLTTWPDVTPINQKNYYT